MKESLLDLVESYECKSFSSST